MKNIIQKYVEIEARQRAKRIDTAFKMVMPKWQWKLMSKTRSRFVGRLLGYKLVTYAHSNKFEIWRWGKKLYYTTY